MIKELFSDVRDSMVLWFYVCRSDNTNIWILFSGIPMYVGIEQPVIPKLIYSQDCCQKENSK